MIEFKYRTKGNANPQGKPRVYFTCHPEDFDRTLDKLCEDIFRTHDCAIYYTENLDAAIPEENRAIDLERMNLFVIPVTFKLLNTPNRAMDFDFPYAIEKHIPVLPILLEPGLDTLYSRKDRFEDLQYLDPYSYDSTAISYEEKLKKYLDSVLIDDETAKKVRAAFDAYIFLSYRKKDRRYANELMRIIHSEPICRDIAIWYDEFLIPGESFNDAISKVIEKSDLFTLLVTPNLVNEENYVRSVEYPAARTAGKDILPAEMEHTDPQTLHTQFPGIPDSVNAQKTDVFRDRLLSSLHTLALRENDNDPAHNFLIGLAYLDGIDVEMDYERARALITSAAESDLIEAIDKLIDMYSCGIAVNQNNERVMYWLNRKINLLEKSTVDDENPALKAALAKAYQSLGEYYSTEPMNNDTVYAITLYKKALALWEGIDSDEGSLLLEKRRSIPQLYRLAAIWCENNNQYDEAQEMYNSLLKQRRAVADAMPDDLLAKRNLALVLCDLGIFQYKIKNGKHAMEYFQEAIDICEPYVGSYDSFSFLYGHANNRAANTLDSIGDSRSALIFNSSACAVYQNLCAKNKALYELRLAESLLTKGIILSSLDKANNLEAKVLYKKAIEIYESNINQNFLNLFNRMVSYYKLANIYYCEGDGKSATETYEKSIAIAKEIEHSPLTEENMSQLAIIYLDYGTLNSQSGNIREAINLLEKAVALYKLLCDDHPEYEQLLAESKDKLAWARGAIESDIQPVREENIDIPPYYIDIQKNIEKGEVLENTDKFSQALDYYFTSLRMLDKLMEQGIENSEYPYLQIDLFERIGSIFYRCGLLEESFEYYNLGYTIAITQLEKTESQQALHAVSFICEKLGSVSNSSEDSAKYYASMYNANKALATRKKSEESLHNLASAAKKLAMVDTRHPNIDLLIESGNIWKKLFKDTLDERYFRLYFAVKSIVEQLSGQQLL